MDWPKGPDGPGGRYGVGRRWIEEAGAEALQLTPRVSNIVMYEK